MIRCRTGSQCRLRSSGPADVERLELQTTRAKLSCTRCDFLCVTNSNLRPILQYFPVIVDYSSNFHSLIGHLCLMQSFGVSPIFSNAKFGFKKLETSIVQCKAYFDILNCLGTTHKCNRNIHDRLCHSKCRTSLCCVAKN